MALIGMRDVRWGFGEPALLDGISFTIEKGERIGLLGRNGVGKSSLLRLLQRRIQPDSGEIIVQQGVRVAALEQEVPTVSDGTLFEVVARGLGPLGEALARFHHLSRAAEQGSNQGPAGDGLERLRLQLGVLAETWGSEEPAGDGLERLRLQLDREGGWQLQQEIETVLSRTELDPQRPFADLSAGMKRRALFARALALDPDLLLLDEPTNHLDIDTIVWLESFLLRHVPTLMFVTHDRAFLERIATRIMELDRGRLTAYACDYRTYLQRREAAMAVEEEQQRQFDKKLAREEAWIRQGVKARRTRNEGRVRQLQALRESFRRRRADVGQANLVLQEAERSGKLVIRAEGLTHGYGAAPIVRDFSATIVRGDKIGIIGPNGVGKTTLIRLLLGNLTPDSGTVRHGTRLQPAYFDQLRDQLDLQKTVVQNIAADNDHIVFNGRKRHVIGYLQDFLFDPERCRTPVHVLSGGERNRLLLAKLFTQPANLLVLDEPTNDLDAETLALLEELLFAFDGTLLLVSHDRCFLNQVVTSTMVFEGAGRVVQYAGGYDDWLSQRPPAAAAPPPQSKPSPPRRPQRPAKSKGLTFSQEHERKTLPAEIEALEAEQQALQAVMADPDFYKQDRETIVSQQRRLEGIEARIAAAYQRWETLEALAQDSCYHHRND
ncbi:ATP-binding cassette domain-containing protein [Desulfatitalea alkaliphila]|uniref:ATP-binding protein Uup n=1 Tax=Desulfatitalea alkaliphila TaxID=2929485 RepID=A0AA41R444_9BACT|nr:ATP-binding cassette domain-containing protein [Desulfatitalea alkaliphila]MCJ8502952.1 ATP-binding cassette domain-containing protein [Desulfatitalea alkaliphila]